MTTSYGESVFARYSRKNQYLDSVRSLLGRDPSPDANMWFVHSTRGDDGNPGSIGGPLKTLSAALAKCRDDRDDCVVALPGSVFSATADLTTSAAGVNILGIGAGGLQPQITISNSTTSLVIGGSGTYIAGFNVHSATGETDSSTGIFIGKGNFTMKNCRLNVIGVGAAAYIGASAGNNITFVGNRVRGSGTAAIFSTIFVNEFKFADNNAYGTWSNGLVSMTSTGSAGFVMVSGNLAYNKSATAPSFMNVTNSNANGYIKGNSIASQVKVSSSESSIADVVAGSAGEMMVFQNFVCLATQGFQGFMPTQWVANVGASQMNASA